MDNLMGSDLAEGLSGRRNKRCNYHFSGVCCCASCMAKGMDTDRWAPAVCCCCGLGDPNLLHCGSAYMGVVGNLENNPALGTSTMVCTFVTSLTENVTVLTSDLDNVSQATYVSRSIARDTFTFFLSCSCNCPRTPIVCYVLIRHLSSRITSVFYYLPTELCPYLL